MGGLVVDACAAREGPRPRHVVGGREAPVGERVGEQRRTVVRCPRDAADGLDVPRRREHEVGASVVVGVGHEGDVRELVRGRVLVHGAVAHREDRVVHRARDPVLERPLGALDDGLGRAVTVVVVERVEREGRVRVPTGFEAQAPRGDGRRGGGGRSPRQVRRRAQSRLAATLDREACHREGPHPLRGRDALRTAVEERQIE